jgi:hypothetical protein
MFGSMIGSLVVHVFLTNAEDGTVAATDPQATRALSILEWLVVHVFLLTQENIQL